MAWAEEEAQKFVTQPVSDMIEFDFGNAQVYISNSKESQIINGQYTEFETVWDGNTYRWVDFKCGGFRNDLTGQVGEPTLTIASQSLFNLTEWQNATSGYSLRDYYGVQVLRQRLFYNSPSLVIPQRYFITQVEALDSTSITFKMTSSLDSENGNRPSARKLEI